MMTLSTSFVLLAGATLTTLSGCALASASAFPVASDPDTVCASALTAMYDGFSNIWQERNDTARKALATKYANNVYTSNASVCDPTWACIHGVTQIAGAYYGLTAPPSPGYCFGSETWTLVDLFSTTDGTTSSMVYCTAWLTTVDGYYSTKTPGEHCVWHGKENPQFSVDAATGKIHTVSNQYQYAYWNANSAKCASVCKA